jgi:hypothetical protein
MLRLFSRVQLAYVGLFFAACVGVFYYQANYIWPMQKCEQHGGWWSDKYHECARPMPIWRFTGRKVVGPPPTPAQAASKVS